MRGVMLGLLLVLFPVCASAAEPPPPTPETLALGRQLIEATGEAGDYRARLDDYIAPLIEGLVQSLPPTLKAQKEAVAGVMQQEITTLIPHLIEAGAAAYATTYTAEELRAQLAFYQTPMGRAIAAKQTPFQLEMIREVDKLKPRVIRNVLIGICAKITCPPAAKRQIEAMPGG